jgi:hypothetical protein
METDPIAISAFVISIITVGFLVMTYRLDVKSHKNTEKAMIENTKVTYAQIMRDFDQDLAKMEESYVTDYDTGIEFSIHILLTLNRLVHLYEKKMIPHDIAHYFDNYFAYGLSLKHWMDKVHHNLGEKDKKKFNEVEEWCNRQTPKIKPTDKGDLPKFIQQTFRT